MKWVRDPDRGSGEGRGRVRPYHTRSATVFCLGGPTQTSLAPLELCQRRQRLPSVCEADKTPLTTATILWSSAHLPLPSHLDPSLSHCELGDVDEVGCGFREEKL